MSAFVPRSRKNEKQIKCRICQGKMYRQNYKAHLERIHPNENCNDLRQFGEQTLNFSRLAVQIHNNNNEETSSNRADTAAGVLFSNICYIFHVSCSRRRGLVKKCSWRRHLSLTPPKWRIQAANWRNDQLPSLTTEVNNLNFFGHFWPFGARN